MKDNSKLKQIERNFYEMRDVSQCETDVIDSFGQLLEHIERLIQIVLEQLEWNVLDIRKSVNGLRRVLQKIERIFELMLQRSLQGNLEAYGHFNILFGMILKFDIFMAELRIFP